MSEPIESNGAELPVELREAVREHLSGVRGPARAISLESWYAAVEDVMRGEGFSGRQPPRLEAKGVRRSSGYGSVRYGRRSWAMGFGVATLMIGLVTLGRHSLSHQNQTVPQQVVSTNVREWKTLHLADKTTVRLAPSSTLRVPSDIGTGQGAIELDGEAYFEVHAHDDVPFIVRTHGAQARVLGTRFAVRHYADERSTQLVVMDGKISFSSVPPSRRARSSAVLSSRMLGVVDDSGYVTVTPNIAVEDYTAWTHGTLVFRQTPVTNIVAELNRAYGVDIKLADSTLGRREFTWTVPVDRVSLDGALKVLTALIHAHVTRSGSTITIVPGTPASRNADVPNLSSSESRYGL